ncbi:MAG: DUF3035 domain-containing protein [Pseudomonadota bacterium]
MNGANGKSVRAIGAIWFVFLVGACGGASDRPADLTNFDGLQDTPDEFMILPTLPLEQPETFSALPTPTPGGRNRTDPTPQADAYAALGGSAGPVARSSADGAVINYTGRFGTSPGIRRTLAVQDAQFRSENRGRVLERLFRVNRYFDVYEDFALDAARELERFRRAGIRTPAAPPFAIER